MTERYRVRGIRREIVMSHTWQTDTSTHTYIHSYVRIYPYAQTHTHTDAHTQKEAHTHILTDVYTHT